MKKLLLIFSFLALLVGESKSQTVIKQQSFEGASTDTWNYTSNKSTVDLNKKKWKIQSGTWKSRSANDGTKFWAFQDGDNIDHKLIFDDIDISMYTDVTISFSYFTYEFESGDEFRYSATGEKDLTHKSLSKNSAGWKTINIEIKNTATITQLVLIADQNGVKDWGGFDNVVIKGTLKAPAGPTLTATPTLIRGLDYNSGVSPSAPKSFTLTGNSLTSNVTTNVSSKFEISTSATGTYSNSLNISHSGGNLTQTIYVRQKSGQPVGTNTGNITFTGGGVTTYPTVTLSGTVNPPCDASVTPGPVPTLSAVTSGTTSAKLDWTFPVCYDEVLVVAGETNGFAFTPSGSSYTGNTTYSSEGQVVYYGAGNNVTVNGLTTGTEYFFKVFVRKGSNWSTVSTTSLTVKAGPTVLKPGDLMIVAYDSYINGSTDQWTLVNLVDLEPGTTFWIANAAYEMKANANQRTERWYGSSEDNINYDIAAQELKYTGTEALPKGSTFCIKLKTGYIDVSKISISPRSSIVTPSFTRSRVLNTSRLGVNISTTKPDAIFFMQGEWSGGRNATGTGSGTDHRTFDGSILGGLMEGAAWYRFDENTAFTASNASRRSRIPAEIECYAIQSNESGGKGYAYYKGVKTGTQSELLAKITDTKINNTSDDKWVFGTGGSNNIEGITCQSSYTFNITGTVQPGIWVSRSSIRDADNDWFNCHNWNTLSVPDKTIDVSIAPTAINDIMVDLKSPKSLKKFAECRNINISKNKLIVKKSTTDPNHLDIYGNLTVSGTGAVDLADASNGNGKINILGNWYNENSTPNVMGENSTVVFGPITNKKLAVTAPTEAQKIIGMADDEKVGFANLILNNPNGLDLKQPDETRKTRLQINTNLTFTSGMIRANATPTEADPLPRVEFKEDATHTGADASKHVIGWVQKDFKTGTFHFPIGDGTFYAPAKISDAVGSGNQKFNAMYVHKLPTTDSYDINEKVSTLNHVSACEYWMLNRVDGSNLNVKVTLPYTLPIPDRSCGVDLGKEGDLKIAHWNGTQWEDKGNTAVSTSTKEVTSDVISSFSPFTLASSEDFNPLPLTLIDFRGHVKNDNAVLNWETSQEVNVKGFEIEFSKDGKNFTTIGFVKANDIKKGVNVYNFIDPNFSGLTYYRIKMLDNDGTFEYTKVITLDQSSKEEARIVIYPNPTNNSEQVRILVGNMDEEAKLMMSCYSAYGQELVKIEGNISELEAALNNTISNAKGIYVVNIYYQGKRYSTKLINN